LGGDISLIVGYSFYRGEKLIKHQAIHQVIDSRSSVSCFRLTHLTNIFLNYDF